MITKAEFQEWRSHPVTKAFMQEVDERIQTILIKLATNIPEDVADDYFKGYYQALVDVGNIDMEAE